jgi:hypothetical protein
MNVTIQSSNGQVGGSVIGQSQISGRPFCIVDLGVGAYINGVYSRFAVVPAHLIVDRTVPNKVEVVNEG